MINSSINLYPCFSDPKTQKWAKVAEVPSDTHDYPVDNLKEGEEYQFRVMSKNDQDVSPPLESLPSRPGKHLKSTLRFVTSQLLS